MLDIREVCSFADYFVLCTAESDRQVEAVAEEIEHVLKKAEGLLPRQREGTAGSGWVLLDYGDVIAHIFAPEERQLYDLDGLWSKAPTVVHIQ